MKQLKMLAAMATIAVAIGALSVASAANGTNQVQRGPRGQGALLEHLLPPRVVQELNLTADQKTKFDSIEADFKAAAAKWRVAHPVDPEAFQKARESGDKEALQKLREQRKELMDIRKAHVDQVRALLTDEQKTTLDQALEKAHEHHPGHAGPGPKGPNGGNPPPPPNGPSGDNPPPPED